MRAIALLCLMLVVPAHAAMFLVDTTGDSGDIALQACDADPGNADCSLRGALLRAQASPGPNTIMFALPVSDPGFIAASGHWRFSPTTELPFITRDLTIDGYSQAGAVANTNSPEQGGSNAVLRIEIRGPGPVFATAGLRVTNSAAALTVRGIAVNRFQVNLSLDAPGAHRVEGCFIGTDITGTSAAETSNGTGFGIRSGGPAIIGGDTPEARNVISGNPYIGISNANGVALTIEGNLIGTNAAGTAALPGQDYGIYLTMLGAGGDIGGSATSARNVISGNDFSALYLIAQVSGTNPQRVRVLGNFIGTDASGTQAIPNGRNPGSPSQVVATINIGGGGACGVDIGEDGNGNVIAHGGASGVQINTCSGARVIGNRFTLNRGIGIDLSVSSNADGTTLNDPGDGDGNPPPGGGFHVSSNRLQNHPEIISLARNAGVYTLTYRVDTDVANATYPLRIDIARGRSGQAEFPVTLDTYLAIDAGLPRSITFPVDALDGGGALVLSSTDAEGNTSEFGSEHLFATGFE